MAVKLPSDLVEFILLGPLDDRRQLQDSPILGDVWVAFANNPGGRLELLITPYDDRPGGFVAGYLDRWIKEDLAGKYIESNISYLQGMVAARLSFKEVLQYVVPATKWWREKRIAKELARYYHEESALKKDVAEVIAAARLWFGENETTSKSAIQDLAVNKRYVALAALILWAGSREPKGSDAENRHWVLTPEVAEESAKELKDALGSKLLAPEDKAFFYNISMNRTASTALTKSVPAVKADAARSLFSVDCSSIVWAVVDSGIDPGHPAFLDKKALVGKDKEKRESRVRRIFDFTKIRDIVSFDNEKPEIAQKRVHELLKRDLKKPPAEEEALGNLKDLARDARDGLPVNWKIVERLVEVNRHKDLTSSHGTHVAGILGADREAAEIATKEVDEDAASGMCPDIGIYDFRVLAPSLLETEFAIIAALQFIRYLNERGSLMEVHGVNLSLSVRHDVRNYACGRTPLCNECERLVNSGIVVVAAAGNHGYKSYAGKDGSSHDGYAAFTVTDPGNAESVITVGSTHRFWPHTYGVSFFSSRGPTGDGRPKPDLVAPGERIRAPFLDDGWGDLDGTSMAAPHVSGAAALLMARYSELIGQPNRIKRILCESATDLGRERSFQGNGMLDVLRAFQKI